MRIRSAPKLLALLLLAGPAAAQQAPMSAALPQDPALRAQLALRDGAVQELSLPDGPGAPFTVTVALDEQPATLVLTPHSVRSDNFKLLVQVEDGSLVEHAPTPVATYKGWVDGMPESRVAASLTDAGLSAAITLAPGLPAWAVQPLRSVDPGAPRAVHVVYDGGDLDVLDADCGNDDVETRLQPVTPGAGDGLDPSHKTCEIALDADYEYYTKNQSSVGATQNDMEAIINAVESIYDATAGIHYEITSMIVRTVSSDPYSTTSASGLLNQFQNHWNSSQGAIQRDVAHLFTGKNVDGSTIGIAYLNVICNKSSAYGLSQSKYTSNFTYRTALTAHELGHNWNASHCNGDGDCKIMCSGLGGCTGGVTSFGNSAKTKITNKKNSVGCLGGVVPPPPPAITSLSPGSTSAFQPDEVTVFGSDLAETTKVTVDGTDITTANGITSIGASSVEFIPPAPSGLGTAQVTVTTAGGTSNALTLTFGETDPPKLVVPAIAQSATPFEWSFGGGSNDPAYLIAALSNSTFLYQGQTILANSFTITVGQLDAAGLGDVTIVLPASAVGLNFWSQLVTLDGPTVKSSNITWNWVVF